MVASIRAVADTCLDKTGTLSVREDILGVYGTGNPQNRSVLEQVGRIQNLPFVKVAIVTIDSLTPPIQRDLDVGNEVWQRECDAWIYPTASITVNAPNLLVLNQDDCIGGDSHSVSAEEDALFDLGRNLGAEVVGYYLQSGTTASGGCAAHPPDRRGFWVSATPLSQWTWVHELTHVVGNNPHSDTDDDCDNTNLMTGCGTNTIVGLANLTNGQCDNILGDDDIESCDGGPNA